LNNFSSHRFWSLRTVHSFSLGQDSRIKLFYICQIIR
jgi:hypothetical protein